MDIETAITILRSIEIFGPDRRMQQELVDKPLSLATLSPTAF